MEGDEGYEEAAAAEEGKRKGLWLPKMRASTLRCPMTPRNRWGQRWKRRMTKKILLFFLLNIGELEMAQVWDQNTI